MVKIRLSRTGRRNRPYWRIGAFDNRTRRDGEPIEYLGFYDPYQDQTDKKVKIDEERVKHWLGHGAQPSKTVAKLLREVGITD
jgi:small subunit ribosomal protein S16